MEDHPSISAPESPVPHPAVDPELVARKIQRYFELCDLSQELALAGIKHRHPEATPQELRRLFAARLAVFREGKWGRK
ncbi:MAG: hypothetical protein JSS02_22670 [Planctomycetes bacterium]|nr:hypothetical protein [Planctomycetota bacterium]